MAKSTLPNRLDRRAFWRGCKHFFESAPLYFAPALAKGAAMTIEKRSVRADDDGLRLDRWLKKYYPSLPHALVQKLVRTGQVRVDGGRVKAEARLCAGPGNPCPDAFCRAQAEPTPSLKPPPGLSKADRDFIERMIVFENDDIVILNKPFGIAVQGGHEDVASHRWLACRDGGPLRRRAPASRAPPRPRHQRHPGRRQGPPDGGAPRPPFPDALGAEDLLGRDPGHPEAAARQGRSRRS